MTGEGTMGEERIKEVERVEESSGVLRFVLCGDTAPTKFCGHFTLRHVTLQHIATAAMGRVRTYTNTSRGSCSSIV
ncbi:hypothetical protein E2C01_028524 [Portunus trituberculatus]|uniref:Uncharacterized protein n=1 Tax=Portunus trituberculatus TaxID=210409 RepID=A0A5B7EKN4_PORTR|nr:hypothetical protein [Portunus trituberculatus]